MFADTFKELRIKADLFQNDIAEALNVTQQTVAKWESGKAMPSVEMICMIAKYFHVSTDYLLGLSDYKNINDQALIKSSTLDSAFDNLSFSSRENIIQITKELIPCIKDFEKYSSKKYVIKDVGSGKYLFATIGNYIKAYQAAADYLNGNKSIGDIAYKLDEMLRNSDQSMKFIWSISRDLEPCSNTFSECVDNIIDLQHALQPVSAGTGVYLSEEYMEKIKVKFDRETARADFCVTVSGNSMEPKFQDGDILLVHKQPDIEFGEYGIFIINNEGFVKMRGKGEIISLNHEYSNIPFMPGDTIECEGKVIGILDKQSIL